MKNVSILFQKSQTTSLRYATLLIVAHRGAVTVVPENTIQAYQTAINLRADAVELDVRLTRDLLPVVLHYFYLDEITSVARPIFNCPVHELSQARFDGMADQGSDRYKISTLEEVVHTIGWQLGLEIEIKGSERGAPQIIGKVLREYPSLWERIQMTSSELQLLMGIQEECSGIGVNLAPKPA